ncbi:MAG TPA: pyridoxal-phosphate dependent enzyme [Chitinophagaceae bacterium]|nr:pyridoxal-phosphate dependent enzyme [Chitinophagaceae bacterium]
MQPTAINNITIDQLSFPLLKEKNAALDVLRADKIHPLVSGNKWFKLRYYLEEAKQQQKKTLVTFGGAWSNHILATAAAANLYQFNSIGIIRGEEAPQLSNTLLQARALGMQLYFISREAYRDKELPAALQATDDMFLIDEGGYGKTGAAGAATMLEYCQANTYTHICCAAGTGTMTAGLLEFPVKAAVIAVSVLKNNVTLAEAITAINISGKQPVLIHNYHFGGYAKYTPELISFMNHFYEQTGIPSDFVYTGKLFYAVHDLISENYFPAGSKILVIHSGGLQGNDSLSKGTLIF